MFDLHQLESFTCTNLNIWLHHRKSFICTNHLLRAAYIIFASINREFFNCLVLNFQTSQIFDMHHRWFLTNTNFNIWLHYCEYFTTPMWIFDASSWIFLVLYFCEMLLTLFAQVLAVTIWPSTHTTLSMSAVNLWLADYITLSMLDVKFWLAAYSNLANVRHESLIFSLHYTFHYLP